MTWWYMIWKRHLNFGLLLSWFSSGATSPYHPKWENVISVCLTSVATLLRRTAIKVSTVMAAWCPASLWQSSVSLILISLLPLQMHLKLLLAFSLIGCKFIGGSSTELCISRANDFFQSLISLIKRCINGEWAQRFFSSNPVTYSAGFFSWHLVNHLYLSTSSVSNLIYIK